MGFDNRFSSLPTLGGLVEDREAESLVSCPELIMVW